MGTLPETGGTGHPSCQARQAGLLNCLTVNPDIILYRAVKAATYAVEDVVLAGCEGGAELRSAARYIIPAAISVQSAVLGEALSTYRAPTQWSPGHLPTWQPGLCSSVIVTTSVTRRVWAPRRRRR